MSLVILLLAAGASSRMRGGDKLMEEVAGAPLIATLTARAEKVAPVIVALPALDHPRVQALADSEATLIAVPDADEGMAASIRTGTKARPDGTTGLMILPGDMPDLTAADLRTLAQAWRSDPAHIHRATTAGGTPGHPVIFPDTLFDALEALNGDTGARGLLQSHAVRPVALPGHHATTDLDTPEDWEVWRKRQ